MTYSSYFVDILVDRNKLFKSSIHIIEMIRNKEQAEIRFKKHGNYTNFEYMEHDIITSIKLNKKVDFIVHVANNANLKVFVEDTIGSILGNFI